MKFYSESVRTKNDITHTRGDYSDLRWRMISFIRDEKKMRLLVKREMVPRKHERTRSIHM